MSSINADAVARAGGAMPMASPMLLLNTNVDLDPAKDGVSGVWRSLVEMEDMLASWRSGRRPETVIPKQLLDCLGMCIVPSIFWHS